MKKDPNNIKDESSSTDIETSNLDSVHNNSPNTQSTGIAKGLGAGMIIGLTALGLYGPISDYFVLTAEIAEKKNQVLKQQLDENLAELEHARKDREAEIAKRQEIEQQKDSLEILKIKRQKEVEDLTNQVNAAKEETEDYKVEIVRLTSNQARMEQHSERIKAISLRARPLINFNIIVGNGKYHDQVVKRLKEIGLNHSKNSSICIIPVTAILYLGNNEDAANLLMDILEGAMPMAEIQPSSVSKPEGNNTLIICPHF